MRLIFTSLLIFFPALLHSAEKFQVIDVHDRACKRNLTKLVDGSKRLTFHLEGSPFYSESEMQKLHQIFDIGASRDGHITFFRKIDKTENAVELLNPFYIPIIMRIDQGKRSWRFGTSNISNHKAHSLKKKDYSLFIRLADTALSRIKTYDAAFYKKLDSVDFRVHFFGIRYYARRGKKLTGVFWHQHPNVRYQGIILLTKPSDLIGGAFLLAERETEETTKVLRTKPRKKNQWKFNLPINHLLTFDGLYTRHATENFELPADREGEYDVREVLGFEIRFPRKE